MAAEIQTKKSLVDVSFPSGRQAAFYPLVAGLLGLAGALIYVIGSAQFPFLWMALVSVLLWTAVPLLLREYSVPGPRGRILLIVSCAIRWWALQSLPASKELIVPLIAVQMIPRSALIALAWVGIPGVLGPRNEVGETLSSISAVVAMAEGLLLAILSGWRFAVVSVAVAYVNADGVRKAATRKLGGVNGTALGAVRQVLEAMLLVLLTLLMRGASQ